MSLERHFSLTLVAESRSSHMSLVPSFRRQTWACVLWKDVYNCGAKKLKEAILNQCLLEVYTMKKMFGCFLESQ